MAGSNPGLTMNAFVTNTSASVNGWAHCEETGGETRGIRQGHLPALSLLEFLSGFI